jgi:hypothetical protein
VKKKQKQKQKGKMDSIYDLYILFTYIIFFDILLY